MLSERLKELRKKKKLTQDELAKLVNSKKTTISNYETGYSTPSNDMLTDLAKIFGVSVDYLLGVNNGGTSVSENKIITEWPQGVQILQRANEKLSETDKVRVLKMIEAFIDEEDED